MRERVLSLDISTKTGWAVFVSDPEGAVLEGYGVISKVEKPDGVYPESFVDWAYICFEKIVELIDRFAPDVLVIEETSGNSKSSHSQKILEFIHFLVAKLIKETRIKSVYIQSGTWYGETGCKISKFESKHNKDVKKYKEEKGTSIAYDKEGNRVGRITRKHVYIRRANEIFEGQLYEPLILKDEDKAAALLLGYSYHVKRFKRDIL